MKRILIFPPYDTWYLGKYAEYLVRYLSDEFEFEIADLPYPPYENFLDRFPETNPIQKSPDDFDLLVPLLASHWGVTEKEKYIKKTALIWYQANEGNFYPELAGLAATTPMAEKSIVNYKYHSVRWGIDTEIFKPLHFRRPDKPLIVGMVGNLTNPRRMTKPIIKALKGLEGVALHLYVGKRPQSEHDIKDLIGCELTDIKGGEKDIVGVANIYNKLDVLIRCDSDPGYSFPTLEAAACGIPVIVTNAGIDHLVVEAGGGIMIDGDRSYYQSNEEKVAKKIMEAVIQLRDSPGKRLAMGLNATQFIRHNYTWDKFIPGWREFLREAVERAEYNNASSDAQ